MEDEIMSKPHAVCVPLPFQSHINAMMQVAKLLNSKGFHITFVNTEFNHRRLLKSRGPDSVKDSDEFRFKTIPDGLDSSDEDTIQRGHGLLSSIQKNCPSPFCNLLSKLRDAPSTPPVTCIISDGFMSFTLRAAEEFGIPDFLFWSIPPCSLLGFLHYPELIERGLIPLKDEKFLSNGYLYQLIDWLPGMTGMRLKDLPSVARVTNPEDEVFKFVIEETRNCFQASATIFNTFEDLEHGVLSILRPMLGSIYTIGPLNVHCHRMPDSRLNSIRTNFWKEDRECLEWLDRRETSSVVYVNFGSVNVLTNEQLIEFAWGLANSKQPFLWIVRSDVIMGKQATLPEEFMAEVQGRGLIASWCPQEEVLLHPSIAVFLTHCGWNSIMESVSGGVPMICWPLYADQTTNCHYVCDKWGIGVEISRDAKRDEIETVVWEMMEGEKGKQMKVKAMVWKESAENAARPGGSSHTNLDGLTDHVLQFRKKKEMEIQ